MKNTISVALVRSINGEIDVQRTIELVRKTCTENAVNDAETARLSAAIDKFWNEPHMRGLQSINLDGLTTGVSSILHVVPFPKNLATLSDQIKELMESQTDRYLVIRYGKNAGYHRLDRFSPSSEKDKAKLIRLTTKPAKKVKLIESSTSPSNNSQVKRGRSNKSNYNRPLLSNNA